jgi:hypothetical protein
MVFFVLSYILFTPHRESIVESYCVAYSLLSTTLAYFMYFYFNTSENELQTINDNDFPKKPFRSYF